MIEYGLPKVNFTGEDGFHWFIGQVVASEQKIPNLKHGYRAKVRILGRHPSTNEVRDDELPWAQFLLPASLGSGNNFGGHSFMLQGGETVVGFFLDGSNMQQPIILGTLFSGDHIPDSATINWTDVLENGSSSFRPISFNPNTRFGSHVEPQSGGRKPEAGGIPNTDHGLGPNSKVKTKQEVSDNEQITVRTAKACKGGKGFLSEVSRALASFIRITSGLQKYIDGYIDPVLGVIQNVQGLVASTAGIISGALSRMIRLARKFLIEEIWDRFKGVIDFLVPDSFVKDIAMKKAVDIIYCVIEKIIKGLKNFLEDFLFGLVDKVVSIPLCAAEQFVAGMMNDISRQVQEVIGPAMEVVNGIVSGIGQFSGFLSKAAGYAQAGLNLISCDESICEPEPYDWALNFGPKKKDTLDFQRSINLLPKLGNLQGDIGGAIDSWFPNQTLDGLSPCDTSSLKCGPPKVEFFGGDGSGGAGLAIVNKLGEIVGVNMTDVGVGYNRAPFVAFVDSCDNGIGATGKVILNDDGTIEGVDIIEPGSGYILPEPGETIGDDEPLDPLTGDVGDIGEVEPEDSNDPNDDTSSTTDGEDLIGEVVGIDVINTGIDYTDDDIILIPGLGQLTAKIDEDGRIVGGDIQQRIFGATRLPDLTINSATGYGAILRPRVRFVKAIPGVHSQDQIIRVVDCPD